MKVKFEAEDREEAKRMIKSLDMALALWDISQLAYEEDVDWSAKVLNIFTNRKINLEDLIS